MQSYAVPADGPVAPSPINLSTYLLVSLAPHASPRRCSGFLYPVLLSKELNAFLKTLRHTILFASSTYGTEKLY